MKERIVFFWVASLAGTFFGGYLLNGRMARYRALVSASAAASDFVPVIARPTFAFLPSGGHPSLFVHDPSPGDVLRVESIKVAREAALQQQLVLALEDTPECGGIGFIPDKGRAGQADFYLRVDLFERDAGTGRGVWSWLLYDRRASRDLAGMGSADSPEAVARDICRNIWRQISPHHFEHPGIRIQ
jgi:hypothetical protein